MKVPKHPTLYGGLMMRKTWYRSVSIHQFDDFKGTVLWKGSSNIIHYFEWVYDPNRVGTMWYVECGATL